MSKKIILVIGVLVIIIGGIFIYRGFIKEEPLDFVLEKVFRGDVYQEVVETGIVRAGEEINLSFKNMGRIEKMAVEVGDVVEPGQALVEIDTTQLFIQLNEARAGLKLAEAGLARLLAGASEQEIRLAETAAANAEIALFNAKKNSGNVKNMATSELNHAYEHSLNILNSVYLKADNAFSVVGPIQQSYFRGNDQESIKVRTYETAIERAKIKIKLYLEIAQNNASHDNIDIALLKAREGLDIISNSLASIREICDESAFRHVVSDISRISLDTQRGHIITALTNIINSQQIIFSTKLANEASINTVQARIDFNEGQFQGAKNALAIKQAEPRKVDIALHQAQIKRARAGKTFLQEQIEESVLRSPVEGKITRTFKRRGEIAQPMMPVILLLPIAQLEIKVDIYEEDVVKIEIGNPVEIDLIAFPDQTLKGKVISIDPTEKLIMGVVHYETTIAFVDELPKGVRTGMTADIIIKPVFRENVLIIDEDAIIKRENRYFVKVFQVGKIQEREIQIGLRGERDRIEIISGLKQGEQVVIR